MRSSGDGLALAISLTIDHTFFLAVSITPLMLPDRSMQNTTSMRGLSSAAGAGAGFAAAGCCPAGGRGAGFRAWEVDVSTPGKAVATASTDANNIAAAFL